MLDIIILPKMIIKNIKKLVKNILEKLIANLHSQIKTFIIYQKQCKHIHI
jgi:hypothetical protein